MKYRILIVEDDRIIARYLQSFLESWGYEAGVIQDFSQVLKEFLDASPDLVLMDVALPCYSGYEWTRQIREVSPVPILFLSSALERMNLVMALSMGADDYITKPFDSDVLAAKIQALLRRAYDFAGKTSWLEHKGLRFNLNDNTIRCQENTAELTKNEAKILRLLMEKKNQIVSRDELMEALWKTDCYVDENALSVNVNRLRRKLEQAGARDYIQTRKGLGYIV